MKILLIGGTGNISAYVAKRLADRGDTLYLLNRGNRMDQVPAGAKVLLADIENEEATAKKLEGLTFDAVCEFIGYRPEQVQRDFRLFSGKTKQYLYISTASAYQRPVQNYRITEQTVLENPYWAYSRLKIQSEEFLMKMYRENGFPVTIVRPSHTYGERKIPVGIHGNCGSWQILQRMLEGKPVLIPGDGTTLWTITASDDFARGFIGLIGNPATIGEAYHITSDESLTWNQIYGLIAKNLGVPLKPYHVASEFLAASKQYDLAGALLGDKAYTVVFDNTKLKRAVPEYHAEITAEQGLKDSVQYALSHPECQIPDPEFDSWCDRVIELQEEAKRAFNQEY